MTKNRTVTLSQALDIAFRHLRAGPSHQAGAIYQPVLARQPNRPDALHMTGVIAYGRRQFEEAVRLVRRAITASPGGTTYPYNLGRALAETGRLVAARDAFRETIAPDTAPRTGVGTTAADALWMDVPVLSLAGGRCIERLSATMFAAAGSA